MFTSIGLAGCESGGGSGSSGSLGLCMYGSMSADAVRESQPMNSYAQQRINEIVTTLHRDNKLQIDFNHIEARVLIGPKNAMADFTPGGKRVIIYDGHWTKALREQLPGAALGIFAHEVGHHCHTDSKRAYRATPFAAGVAAFADGRSDWQKELEADAIAGYVMAKMGVEKSHADQAMTALAAKHHGPEQSKHPPLQVRRKAVHLGWKEGGGESASRTSNWCPCGCQQSTGNYDPDFERRAVSDEKNAPTETPMPREAPSARTGYSRQQYSPQPTGYWMAVPCVHPHPCNPYQPAHLWDWVWMDTTGMGGG
ncbi:MAG: hypothetical protein ACKVS9_06340 [Phycisphaerae bacterium]